jgi:hypothetical protein
MECNICYDEYDLEHNFVKLACYCKDKNICNKCYGKINNKCPFCRSTIKQNYNMNIESISIDHFETMSMDQLEVFTVNYNILRIWSGIASLPYSN